MKQKKDKFRCRNCGYCCTLIVELSKGDIKRISDMGYDEKDFVETGPSRNKRIKLNNYYCYFLGLLKGETFCKIYKGRPKVCQDYPFLGKDTAEFRELRPEESKITDH